MEIDLEDATQLLKKGHVFMSDYLEYYVDSGRYDVTTLAQYYSELVQLSIFLLEESSHTSHFNDINNLIMIWKERLEDWSLHHADMDTDSDDDDTPNHSSE